MGRPIKTGLDYFPMNVSIDDNLELIEAEHGLPGFAIVVKLWQKIYKNGYFIEWDQDNALLFSKKINSELNLINSVINSCFSRKIFNEKLYKKHGILTSSGIQKRYLNVCAQSKRKYVSFIKEFLLVNSEFTNIISEFTSINSEISAQSKVKESKVKESKEVLLSKIQKEFYDTLTPFVKEFGKETVREFYNYWSEPNKSRTKIRWQMEKTWDVKRRLQRWDSNSFNKNKSENELKVIIPQI